MALGRSFERWLGPKLRINGAALDYRPVFWGDALGNLRWDLACRPKTALLSMGGAPGFAELGSLRAAGKESPLDGPAPAAVVEGP